MIEALQNDPWIWYGIIAVGLLWTTGQILEAISGIYLMGQKRNLLEAEVKKLEIEVRKLEIKELVNK